MKREETPVFHTPNSSEGNVISPPTVSRDEMSLTTQKTKPTTPGKTKTGAGAAVASFAARLDNVAHTWNKSVNQMSTAACGSEMEEGRRSKEVAADATVTTDYYREHKMPTARKIPRWIQQVGWFTLAAMPRC